MMQCLTRTVN